MKTTLKTTATGDNLPAIRRRLTVPALPMGHAAVLAQTAGYFACDIFILYGARKANAKSLMCILSLGIEDDASIAIQAEGHDAREAVNTLMEVLHADTLSGQNTARKTRDFCQWSTDPEHETLSIVTGSSCTEDMQTWSPNTR